MLLERFSAKNLLNTSTRVQIILRIIQIIAIIIMIKRDCNVNVDTEEDNDEEGDDNGGD